MYNSFESEGHGNLLIMTQALPNPSEGISNYLDNYLEVSNVNDMITL